MLYHIITGPMDTDMQTAIREAEGCDPATRAFFREAKDRKGG